MAVPGSRQEVPRPRLWAAAQPRRLPGPGLDAPEECPCPAAPTSRRRAHPMTPGTAPPLWAAVCRLEMGRAAAPTSSGGGEDQVQERRAGDTVPALDRLGPAPSSVPAARCPQSPPSPQHSHEQLEDPREDQVVAGDGPAPAEQHHPRHGEEPAARARAGSPRARCHSEPRALRSPPPNRDSAQAHAGAGAGGKGGGEKEREAETGARALSPMQRPLGLCACADELTRKTQVGLVGSSQV